MRKQIIAIDPDVDKSGVALLSPDNTLKISGYSFPEVCDMLISNKGNNDLILVVEEGYFTTCNWHIKGRDSPRVAAAKGYAVGRNHEVGMLIVEMAKHYGIEVVAQKPLLKHWKGRDNKITAKEFNAITGYTGRTSQDERDAGLLAWVYAGNHIRLPVTSLK